MKIAASSGKPSKKAELIIPLEDDEAHHKLTKENSVTWELRTIPNDNNSPTYKVQARILSGEESVRQMVRWMSDVQKVCIGLNATTLAQKKPIMVACMRPRVETLFQATLLARAEKRYNEELEDARTQDQANGNNDLENALVAAGVDPHRHVDDLLTGLQEVLQSLMPAKVLAKVKRQLRREMRKPVDMKVCSYCQHLLRLNTDDIPNLPPFAQNQGLSSDELLDILLFGTPRSWQNEMERQGFDPIEKGYYPTVDFMENLEGLEERSLAQDSKSKGEVVKTSSKKSKTSSSSGEKKKTTHYCEVHGPNWTHNTSECRVVKKEKDGKSSNKTWSRKADESSSKSKKELAALLAKSVQKQVKKELAAMGKKRKSKSDDSDTEECALVQIMEEDLEGFNYEDMEKMSLNDDDSISV